MLRLENVSKLFKGPRGTVEAIGDITFSLDAGEFVSVRGPSGCGKSTLLLTAGALLNPTSGKVFIDDKDVYGMGLTAQCTLRSSRIGFVFQQFHLVPYLTVLDNIIAASVGARTNGIYERAYELLTRFNLGERADHRPAQLSTGEKQRTALARAVLNKPGLILADEPTGNLDEENGAVVLDFLKEFADEGAAVLVVTHDSRIVARADRDIKLQQGRIVHS